MNERNNKYKTNRNKKNKRERYYHRKSESSSNDERYNKFNYSKRNTKNIKYDICPFCEKEIKESLIAVLDRNTKKNSHFECVLTQIKKDHSIGNAEKVFYLGGGCFGVVQTKKVQNRFIFDVIEKIQYLERPKKRR